jgi:hypothetical protein
MGLGDQHPANWQLDLNHAALSPGWMWAWLRSESQLPLSLLAVGVDIMLIVIWGSIVTPFAAALRSTSPLLVFLVLTQFAVLLTSRLLTGTRLRVLIGKPFRPLPQARRQMGRRLLLLVLLGLACCLLLFGFGLPLSWPFALVFGAYTFCGAFWSLLLPRVLLTREMCARETPLSPSVWQLPSEWPDQQVTLAVAREQERAVARWLEQMSLPFLLLGLPLCGWLIDKGGMHRLCLLVNRREQRFHLPLSQEARRPVRPQRTAYLGEGVDGL